MTTIGDVNSKLIPQTGAHRDLNEHSSSESPFMHKILEHRKDGFGSPNTFNHSKQVNKVPIIQLGAETFSAASNTGEDKSLRANREFGVSGSPTGSYHLHYKDISRQSLQNLETMKNMTLSEPDSSQLDSFQSLARDIFRLLSDGNPSDSSNADLKRKSQIEPNALFDIENKRIGEVRIFSESKSIAKTGNGPIGDNILVELQWMATGKLSIVADDKLKEENHHNLVFVANYNQNSTIRSHNRDTSFFSNNTINRKVATPTLLQTTFRVRQSMQATATSDPMGNHSNLYKLIALSFSEIPKRKMTIINGESGVDIIIRDYSVSRSEIDNVIENLSLLQDRFGSGFQSLTINGRTYNERGL